MRKFLIAIMNLYETGEDIHQEVEEFEGQEEASEYARQLWHQRQAGGGGYAVDYYKNEAGCFECKYYHGRAINCAVHPGEPDSAFCSDFEARDEEE